MKRILIALLVGIPTTALAHSWYDAACCSGTDCRPIASCDLLVEQNDGSYIYTPTDMKFSKDKIKPSQDSKCHICFDASGTTYCAYIVMGT